MDDIWGEYPTGNYVFREHEYEYDDKIRPFFNIDNAFVYDPIFGQGTTTPNHIRMLSTNNLIKYSRSSWHYTYNEEGLPIELRRRFEGVTPVNDPKYVFTYRKCDGYVGTSTATITVPNTNANKFIHNGQLLILRDGKTYNIMGMEIK